VSSVAAKRISIAVDETVHVSGLLQNPEAARACFVLAHGAGAGMEHPFMVAVAAGLAVRGIANLRYQFPSMERQIKRPDPPQVAQATVRAVVTRLLDLLPNVPLIAGGKSFGGRMTSQAQAKVPTPGRPSTRVFWLSLAPGRSSVSGSCSTPVSSANPDAVSARHPRPVSVAR
jgi:hypothetical protein